MTKPIIPATSPAALHAARSSGMIQDLKDSGVIPPRVDVTDVDVEQCTAMQRSDARSISEPGVHLLMPVNLTNVEYVFDADSVVKRPCMPFADTVFEALTSIKTSDVNEDVTLCIPIVTLGHWCLASVTVRNQAIDSAELWDPRANANNTAKDGEAFKLFSEMLATYTESRVELKLISAGVQAKGNDYSCADYVVQKAYQKLGLNNAITRASNPNALRLAFAKQIVAGHASFGVKVANNLVMLPDGKIQQAAPQYKIEHAEVKRHLQALRGAVDKTQLADFDVKFAKHLQTIYYANRENAAADEKALVREAQNLATLDQVREAKKLATLDQQKLNSLGMFSQAAKKPEPVQAAEQQHTATVKP